MGSCGLKHFAVALQQAGDFICTVYLEEKKTETEQHVKVSSWAEGEEVTGVPSLYVQASVVAWGLMLSWHLCGVRMEGPWAVTDGDLPPPSQIPATMTAEELTFAILDRRKIVMKEKDYWSCFEVNEREEAGWCRGMRVVVRGREMEMEMEMGMMLGMEMGMKLEIGMRMEKVMDMVMQVWGWRCKWRWEWI